MKKFFNRAFTKAIAVAAAASIATGVLAGCNVQGNVEKEEVEAGFQPITQSVEFAEDETVTMTVNGYEYNNASGILAISCKAINDTKTNLVLDGGTDKGDVTVIAYFDAVTNVGGAGEYPMPAGTFADNIAGKTIASNVNDSVGGVLEGNGYFKVSDDNKDWKTVTLVVTVMTDNAKSETATFVINR